LRWAIRFWILRRSDKSEIFVQSSSGFAAAQKALLVAWRRYCLGGEVAGWPYVYCMESDGSEAKSGMAEMDGF